MANKNNTVTLFTFIGMTCALVMSIRNIPDVSAAGWLMVLFMLISVFLYALPIALIAGEFGSLFPGASGGMEAWVNNTLGEKWGFTTSWLLWVQMFPGMVMVSSALVPLIAIVIGKPEIGQNHIFTFVCIVVVYWAVTLLNFFFDMEKIGGKFGFWIGVFIPMCLMMALGIAAMLKIHVTPGLFSDNLLSNFSMEALLPNEHNISAFQYLAPIMFIFTGIEMSAVHADRLKNPAKEFISGVLVALVLMFIFNLGNALMVARVVSATGPNAIQLNNIAQPISLYLQVLGLPAWWVNVFAIMVLVGVLVQLSAWSVGPAFTIVDSAKEGLYPPKFGFYKLSKNGMPTRVIITQAVMITLFAFVYLIIPGANSAFLVLVTSTSVLYSLAYILMGCGIIEARKKGMEVKDGFHLGSDCCAKFVVALLIVSIIISTALTLAYSSLSSSIAVMTVAIVLFVIPLIIVKKANPQWKVEVNKELGITTK